MKNKTFFIFLFPIFLFVDCKNACEDITCQNDGICINGFCDCHESFEGPDCSIQKTPSVIKITKIRVQSFNQGEFDPGGDPEIFADIYVELSHNGQIFYKSPIHHNAWYTYFDYTPTIPIEIYPENQYSFELFDDNEPDDPELLHSLIFTPYSPDNGFPIYTRYEDSDSYFYFVLWFDYEF